MTDKEKLKKIVSVLSERYYSHESQVVYGFFREEARAIKEILDDCGLELEENHVGNTRHEKWLAATGRDK